MNQTFFLEFVRVTEQAALESARWRGLGQEKAADQAAVSAMRKALQCIDFQGTVVIGEGERDDAPMLFIGEKVGRGLPDSPRCDLALDPLEGTTLCAKNYPGAITVLAIAGEDCFLHAPDTYMNKMAVGPALKGIVDLSAPVGENLRRIAHHRSCKPQDINVCLLERDRHQKLLDELRSFGVRVHLIPDGDVCASIATCLPDSGIDLMLGIGGAPEGVLAAAALKCLGGDFQGQLVFRNDSERARAYQMGITDFDQIYSIEQLASGPVLFCATGVTDGSLVKGVQFLNKKGAKTFSLVMHSGLAHLKVESQTIRWIETFHGGESFGNIPRELSPRDSTLIPELKQPV